MSLLTNDPEDVWVYLDNGDKFHLPMTFADDICADCRTLIPADQVDCCLSCTYDLTDEQQEDYRKIRAANEDRVKREVEAERDAKARTAMLDQARQPGGIDVDAACLIPREINALKELRDEGKLQVRYVDPITGEVFDEWREGTRAVVTPNEAPVKPDNKPMAEFAGNDPNRCGVDAPFGPHRFHPSTDILVRRYDALRMTCWQTPDDPIHDPATMCGSTSYKAPHTFEPGANFQTVGVCAWPADAEIHQSAKPTGDAGPATGDAAAEMAVDDLKALLQKKKHAAAMDRVDAAIAVGREKDEASATDGVLDWMGVGGAQFDEDDTAHVVALSTAEKAATAAYTALHAAAADAALASKLAVDMAARHVGLAAEGAAGGPYRKA